MDSPSILHTIKWNDHKREIIEEQKYLYDNNLESDCVLISAQGIRIQAHQIVLSSSSEFFRKILSELPLSIESPTIHIPDVDTLVLEAILKFIYTGETNIASGYLTTLLEFCNFLDIKGCVANGFTLNGTGLNVGGDINLKDENGTNKPYNSSSESWSCEEYLVVTQADSVNSEEDSIEPDYLEEYLEDDGIIKEEQLLIENEDEESRHEANEFISYEIENSVEEMHTVSTKDITDTFERSSKRQRNIHRQTTRSTSSQIDKALNEVNNGKTIHRLSVEYNLPRSTLYHRFRNNENLKQNYRLERKSALDNAVQAVLHERLSLKTAADRYKVPKTAIWREVRKSEQYQPSNKEVTVERQNAQREILSGKSLTSISAKFGIPLTTLHRDKKKLSVEGKLHESFRVKDRTENSEYGQRLEMALKKCRSGMSQYQAAKLFNIPKATMWRYANALNKSNRKTKVKQNEQSIDEMNKYINHI